LDDFLADQNAGDDIRLGTDAVSSLIDVNGDVIVSMNTGLDDDFNFNLDAGDMNVAGDILITRADDYGPVDFDLDGGNLVCNDIVINSNGALFTLGAVRFSLMRIQRLIVVLQLLLSPGQMIFIFISTKMQELRQK
jgi:hypothetical protein